MEGFGTNLREQPPRREDGPRVRPRVRGREECSVRRERDEDEQPARMDAVGEDTRDDSGDAPCSVGRDEEELGGRCGEAEASDDRREEEGERIAYTTRGRLTYRQSGKDPHQKWIPKRSHMCGSQRAWKANFRLNYLESPKVSFLRASTSHTPSGSVRNVTLSGY